MISLKPPKGGTPTLRPPMRDARGDLFRAGHARLVAGGEGFFQIESFDPVCAERGVNFRNFAVGQFIQRGLQLFREADQCADDVVRFAERYALFHKIIDDIGS